MIVVLWTLSSGWKVMLSWRLKYRRRHRFPKEDVRFGSKYSCQWDISGVEQIV